MCELMKYEIGRPFEVIQFAVPTNSMMEPAKAGDFCRYKICHFQLLHCAVAKYLKVF